MQFDLFTKFFHFLHIFLIGFKNGNMLVDNCLTCNMKLPNHVAPMNGDIIHDETTSTDITSDMNLLFNHVSPMNGDIIHDETTSTDITSLQMIHPLANITIEAIFTVWPIVNLEIQNACFLKADTYFLI
ncbi:hypothetical protein RF11_03472 [Thelohanellus kitauei]|uniref:Uncharacterized protein n=1 Tax=Thelohanellus kitauei TaxID=669202 RepID=A0A0C2J0V8_THEKT|nr:hypothetical protein RF11_03472 [Thelohanellus kitauei]